MPCVPHTWPTSDAVDLCVAARQSPAVPRVRRLRDRVHLLKHSAVKPRPAAPADPDAMD